MRSNNSAKLLERLDQQCPAIIKICKQSGGLILFPCSASSLICLHRIAMLCYSVWCQEAGEQTCCLPTWQSFLNSSRQTKAVFVRLVFEGAVIPKPAGKYMHRRAITCTHRHTHKLKKRIRKTHGTNVRARRRRKTNIQQPHSLSGEFVDQHISAACNH